MRLANLRPAPFGPSDPSFVFPPRKARGWRCILAWNQRATKTGSRSVWRQSAQPGPGLQLLWGGWLVRPSGHGSGLVASGLKQGDRSSPGKSRQNPVLPRLPLDPGRRRHTSACVWPLPLRRAATQDTTRRHDTATPQHRDRKKALKRA
jgi:hypothetical protein